MYKNSVMFRLCLSGFLSALGLSSSLAFAQSPIEEIRGGEPVSPERYHAVVQFGSLSKDTNQNYTFFHLCVGTLISPKKVLTSAHCLVDADTRAISTEDFYIAKSLNNKNVEKILPGLNLKTKKDLRDAGIITRKISAGSWHVHPSFLTETEFAPGKYIDMAVLEFKKPIVKIDPMLIANKQVVQDIEPGTKLTAAGYGYYNGSRNLSDSLLYAELRSLSTAECRRVALEMSTEITLDNLRGVQICTYEKKKNTCMADSGAPLILVGADGSEKIVGVNSWSLQKDEKYCSGNYELDIYEKPVGHAAWVDSVSGLDYSIR